MRIRTKENYSEESKTHLRTQMWASKSQVTENRAYPGVGMGSSGDCFSSFYLT